MLARPKPGEDEENILAMQEAYLKEKEKNKDFQPSAKVVNMRKHKPNSESETGAKQSKWALDKGLNKKSRVSFDDSPTVIGDVVEKATEPELQDDKVYFPAVISSVLGDIVEKTYSATDYEYKSSLNASVSGFPRAKKRDNHNAELSKMSIEKTDHIRMDNVEFPDISKAASDNSECMSMETEDFNSINTSTKFFEKSVILHGENAQEIHIENKKTLKKMSESEILKEQKNLITTLDPKIVEFIKSLRKNYTNNSEQQNIQNDEIKTTAESVEESKSVEIVGTDSVEMKELLDNDVIQHPNLDKWVHFDTLETDKLQWTKDFHDIVNIGSKPSDEPYEARFDFKGYLQPFSVEYTEKTKILFHHGEDPHRPGYTLNELFQLCRSTVTQQRVLALKSIAGMLEYNSMGIYENVFDIPLTKIYFVLRFALDENVAVILEPTLKAMRNMFYNRIDEACLDFLLCTEEGLMQPRLVSMKLEKSETEQDISEIKDFHLVDLDLVKGAIRTDLIPRLRYILTTVKPSFLCVEYILQILTRMLRDSTENIEIVFNTDGLMDAIVENYIPKYITFNVQNTENCKLVIDTLKMIRVAVSQSKTIAELFCTKYDVFANMLSYFGNVIVENTILLKIQIEMFYLWSCFVHYGLGMSCLTDVKGLLLRVLNDHTKNTELHVSYPAIMHSHVAALFTLLSHARLAKDKYAQSLPDNYFEDFMPIALFAFRKWSSQLGSLTSYTAGHLKSISTLLTFISTNHELELEKFDRIPEITQYLRQTIHCDGFLILSSKLIRNSNLLSSIEIESCSKKMSKTNNPSLYGYVVDKEQNVLPILTVSSPICFLLSLSKYILICKNKRIRSDFIQHNVIVEYVKAISGATRLNLSDNWFTKVELQFLCNVIYICVKLDLSDVMKEILYNFAFKLTYILNEEYKSTVAFILKQIVFNKDWFTTERLLRNLNVTEAGNLLNHLKDIFDCYDKVLNLNQKSESKQSLTLSNWNHKVLPRDWMFMPILGLYSQSQDLESERISTEQAVIKESYIKQIIICSLEWILISELYFPEITNEISLTDRFCRLCCVFLCDNSIFLDSNVKFLLNKCVKILFDSEKSPLYKHKFNFDKNIVGINSFQDFYTQLIDQFQAVSYGDPLFAACVLVPLAQHHNIKWRKLVWSEYAACLRSLDCPQQYLCYNLDKYLEPAELDFSLLKCYHRALVTKQLRPETMPYQIALTHVEHAKKRQQKSNN